MWSFGLVNDVELPQPPADVERALRQPNFILRENLKLALGYAIRHAERTGFCTSAFCCAWRENLKRLEAGEPLEIRD